MTVRALRTLEDQRQIDADLDVPRHLRGWHVGEFLHNRGTKKAKRLIRWAVEIGGSAVTGFPIDRTRPPGRFWDYTTGHERRLKPPGAKVARVIALPIQRSRPKAA